MPSNNQLHNQKQAAMVLERKNKDKGMEHVHMALKKMEELEMPKMHSPKSQKFFASRKVGK